MSKMGRPKAEKPKCFDLKVRVDKEMIEMIDFKAKELNITRAEVVRTSLDKFLGIKK